MIWRWIIWKKIKNLARLRLAKFFIFFPNYPPPDHNLDQILNSDLASSYFPLKHINEMHQFYFKNKDGLVLLIKDEGLFKEMGSISMGPKKVRLPSSPHFVGSVSGSKQPGGPAAGIWVRHSTINYSSHCHLHSLSTRI